MKNRVVISLVLAGSLILVGFVICIVGLAVTNFDLNQLNSDQYEQKVYTTEALGLTDLSASSANQSIIVKPTNDSMIRITYYESVNEHYTITNENGKLNMVYVENRKLFPMTWFSIHRPETGVVIELPVTYTGSLRLKTSNARVSLGDLKLNGPIDATTSNASIEIRDLDSTGECVAKTSNATIDFENIVATSVRADTSNGRIDAASIKAERINLATSNGKIEFSAIEASQIDLKTSNSKVVGTIVGRSSDYRIDSHTSNSDNSLANLGGSGPNSLTVKTSNGNIEIKFTE